MLIKDSSADRRSLSDLFSCPHHSLIWPVQQARTEQQAQSPCLAHYCLLFPEEWKKKQYYYISQDLHIQWIKISLQWDISKVFFIFFKFRRTSLVGIQVTNVAKTTFFYFLFFRLFCLALPCYPTFTGDKLERVAEYSKTWDSFFRAIINKLMAQPIPTLSTKDLQISTIYYSGNKIKSHCCAPRASAPPWRLWESPSSCWHCLLWWFLWRLAKEKSGGTWSDWRTVGGCTGSTHKFL